MICPYCGCYNKDSAKFCSECGKSLNPVSTMKKEYLDAHDKSKQSELHEDSANNSVLGNSTNLIIICLTVILCMALIMGSVLYISSNYGHSNINSSNVNKPSNIADNSVNQTTDDNTDNDDSDDSDDATYTTKPVETDTSDIYDNIKIISGSFYTGSKLSDRTRCKVYVGDENAGVKLKIRVLYSRDGNDLNPGKIVPKTVDSNGYVSLKSANAFKYYPDYAYITLYDLDDNVLDNTEVSMSATKGTQTF